MATIGLVVGNSGLLTAGDTALETLLESDGHTVSILDDSVSPDGSFDLYVLAETCTVSLSVSSYESLASPIINFDIGSWDNMALATVANTNGGSYRFFDLEVHEITAGITPTDECEVRTGNSGMWGVAGGSANLAPGAVIFARKGDVSTHIMGYTIDAGDELVGGAPAPARRVCLGYIDNYPTALTANGLTLLLQAVDWALGGGAVTGTLAVTQADQTSSASGVLGYTGTVAVTQADQTLAASGVIADNIGTVAVVQEDQISAASGDLGYSGTLAVTQGSDTAAASGTVDGPSVSGTVAVTQDDQTATASGTYDSSSIRDIKVLAKSGPVTSWRASDLAASPWSAGDPVSGWRVRLPSHAVFSSTSPRSHWSASRPFVEQTVSEPS